MLQHTPGSTLVLDNDKLRAEFDGTTGMLARLIRKDTGVDVAIVQELLWYKAADGKEGAPGGTGSGNYIFQPQSNVTYSFTATGAPESVVTVNGSQVSEIRHVFVNNSIEQVFRLYKNSDVLEVEYRIGVIDTSDGVGHEVISRFTTDITSGDKFYTDGNGGEMVPRRKNSRAPLWPKGPEYFSCTEPTACNYFAVNTMAAIEDDTRRFTCLLDRSEGGTSLRPGQLELMLHRRLTSGCRWGMCEDGEKAGLNDVLGAEVVIKHWLSVDQVNKDGTSSSMARTRAQALNYPPSLLFSTIQGPKDRQPAPQKWPSRFDPLASTLPLPDNIELSTFETTKAGKVVLRLTHLFPSGEHPTLSTPATVNLAAFLGDRFVKQVTDFTETYASADASIEDVTRLAWKVHGEPVVPRKASASAQSTDISKVIIVAPADTRTFVLTMQH